MTVVDLQALDKFKAAQRQGWAHFAPIEVFTTAPAARLVRFAGIKPGHKVLDVACGTGVAAITAALQGARVHGLDLTPELIERAKENGRTCRVEVDWRVGDAEQLPYADGEFDVVMSQFGHMFAPRPEVAIGEMLRVLKRGGTIAFSTWPPDQLIGRSFSLVSSYMPPPPPGVSPPPQWGDPTIVRERLGQAVKGLTFDRDLMAVPALSPVHQRSFLETTVGPMIKLVAELQTTNPAKLEQFRREYEAMIGEYFENNLVRQNYLMSRAVKA